MTNTTALLATVTAERDPLIAGLTEYRRVLDDDPELTWRGGVVSADLDVLVRGARTIGGHVRAAAAPVC